MYLRMVEANVIKGKEAWLERVYEDNILHSLAKTPGCVFAGLMYSVDSSNKYLSLTIWNDKQDAENYVENGGFNKNLEKVNPALVDSNEWKIRLTKNHEIEYAPVQDNPVVRSYSTDKTNVPVPESDKVPRYYMRVLSLKINPGKMEEFSKLYHKYILPKLKKVNGCKYAFLIDDTSGENEILSFTIWDNPDSIHEYENNGLFQSLIDGVKHTFSELYQWKLSLEQTPGKNKSVTSHDIVVQTFTVVASKNFIR